jgi:nucleoside-diphosphate-sugar epimerase
MNVLLTGASAFIGGNVTAVLTQAGHQVRPVSRRHGCDVSKLLTPEDWAPLLRGIAAAADSPWAALGDVSIEEEAIGANRYRMDFHIHHPLFGQVFRYAGEFTTDAGEERYTAAAL